MTAQRDSWKQDAEDALHAAGLWRDVAIGAAIMVPVVFVLGLVL